MHQLLKQFEESLNLPSPLSRINIPDADNQNIEVFVKRDDLIHPLVSGNKWRKLKYLLKQFYDSDRKLIISFGGNHSNHLHALSFACHSLGIQFIAITRDGNGQDSPTLNYLRKNNHQIEVVSRQQYRQYRMTPASVLEKFPGAFIIEEGGKDALAIQGVQEMVDELPQHLFFDYFVCACGTGTTFASIAHKMQNTSCIGMYSFKKSFLVDEIASFTNSNFNKQLDNIKLNGDFHFGGFGYGNEELHSFMDQFFNANNILLDPIYNAKSFYGLSKLIEREYFKPNSRILVLHSGGLQGLQAYQKRYEVDFQHIKYSP